MNASLSSLVCVWAILAPIAASQDARTPAQRYREINRDYNAVSSKIRLSKTVDQRKAVARQFDQFAKRFLDLAEQKSQDPIALTAIRSAIQAIVSTDSRAQNIAEFHPGTLVAGSSDGSSQRAVEILMRDHVGSDRVAPICDRMRFSYRPEFEPFLMAVIRENPHRSVQGLAQLAIAQLLHNQLRLLDLSTDRPELSKRYSAIYRQGYIKRLQQIGRNRLVERIEHHYEAALRFEDVPNLPFQSSVASKAKTELRELRLLSAGSHAPEIAGQDQDASQLRLSDFRGKVVLLYFWQEY